MTSWAMEQPKVAPWWMRLGPAMSKDEYVTYQRQRARVEEYDGSAE